MHKHSLQRTEDGRPSLKVASLSKRVCRVGLLCVKMDACLAVMSQVQRVDTITADSYP